MPIKNIGGSLVKETRYVSSQNSDGMDMGCWDSKTMFAPAYGLPRDRSALCELVSLLNCPGGERGVARAAVRCVRVVPWKL